MEKEVETKIKALIAEVETELEATADRHIDVYATDPLFWREALRWFNWDLAHRFIDHGEIELLAEIVTWCNSNAVKTTRGTAKKAKNNKHTQKQTQKK